MLGSIYHMTLKLRENRIFWRQNANVLPSFT